MPLPPVKCDVSGLLFEYPDKYSDCFRLFDLHTPVFHTLPPIPTTMMQASDVEDDYEYKYDDTLIGMTLDTILIPYSLKIILADKVIGTRIYDSKSGAWMQKPSTYAHSLDVYRTPSCVNHNQFLYIKVPGRARTTFDLHAYGLQRDEWV